MSYNGMKGIAVHVAVDVTKFDRDEIEFMVNEFGWENVHNFFESYKWQFCADVDKQLDWIDEIVQEMEV